MLLPGFVDPDSGLLGFVGPEGLIGLFIVPLPEGEAADGLLVKPGDVEPEVPAEGLAGMVVAPPAAPGAVAAPPVLGLPPIAAPPPATPAAPPAAPPPPPPPAPWA